MKYVVCVPDGCADEPVDELGGRTPLGPLRLSMSVTTDDDWQVVLGIGRPIEEGVITDPVW